MIYEDKLKYKKFIVVSDAKEDEYISTYDFNIGGDTQTDYFFRLLLIPKQFEDTYINIYEPVSLRSDYQWTHTNIVEAPLRELDFYMIKQIGEFSGVNDINVGYKTELDKEHLEYIEERIKQIT